MKAHINILGGKLFDFIPHCLGLTDSGYKELILNGYGGDASKALVLAQMMSKVNGKRGYKLDAKISEIAANFAPLNTVQANASEFTENTLLGKTTQEDIVELSKNGFVDFSTYHLLLWNALHQQKELKFKVDLYRGGPVVDLLTVRECKKKKGEIELEVSLEKPRSTVNDRGNIQTSRVKNMRENQRKRRQEDDKKNLKRWEKTRKNLVNGLYRAGFLLPHRWAEMGSKLTDFDDVIIGLDTNLLQDAFVSTTLLPVLSVIEHKPYLQTPNWLLLVIPKMVVYELERAANTRSENGGDIVHSGRKGYRALQEIMELRKNYDHKGVSIVTTGEPDGMLDMNAYLKSINENLFQMLNKGKDGFWVGSKTPKGSSADMIIRTQFKSFVDGLNLGKGSYFMTSDKVNAAMHTSQGNEAIYVSKPHTLKDKFIYTPELIPKVSRTIPLGTLLYELTVEFGSLYVQIDSDTVVRLESDFKGQTMTPWIKRQLRIPESRDFDALIEKYNGSLSLVKVQQFYNEISQQLEKDCWVQEDFEEYDESYFGEE